MDFRILGLDPTLFRPLYGLDDAALAARGARRVIADTTPGYPDRIGLRDLEPGERALLLNFTHQPAANAYRASHAIFVAESAESRYDAVNEVPTVLRVRPLSLRAFDHADEMVDADLVDGRSAEALIRRLLADDCVAYLHAHFAKRGCYAAQITRA